MFGDESRKRAPSARGQGGSVAGDADNLSQRRPLAALCPNLWGEMRRDRQIFAPSFIAALARRSVALSCQHFALYDLAQESVFPPRFSGVTFHLFTFHSARRVNPRNNGAFRLLFGGLVCFSALLSGLKFYLVLAPDEFENVPLVKSINPSLPGPSSSSFCCDEDCTGRTFAAGKVIWITSSSVKEHLLFYGLERVQSIVAHKPAIDQQEAGPWPGL